MKGEEHAKRIRMLAEKHKGAHVTIGIHSDAGKYTGGKNPPDVVQVALWNEFGTQTIPQRSFFRSALRDNEAKINRWREEMLNHMVTDNWSIEDVLNTMGQRIQILIQNKIKSNVPPPNALGTTRGKQRSGVLPQSATLKGRFGMANKRLKGKFAAMKMQAQGKTKTLIDSGLMLRSVTYKVHV